MEIIRELAHKYSELIRYSFWGTFAVIANVSGYFICFDLLHFSNTTSTLIAWFASVLVAFFTNKLFVFHSRKCGWKKTLREFGSFTTFRLVSEIFDLAIMVWAVDMMGYNSLVWKLVANVIVIALNYIFSKFVIFRVPEQNPTQFN